MSHRVIPAPERVDQVREVVAEGGFAMAIAEDRGTRERLLGELQRTLVRA